MSGGANQAQPNALTAAANAQASGTGGTAGTAASAAAMPTWAKGFMGAMTGSPAFGQNAPAIHAMMQQGMGLLQSPQIPPQQMVQPGQPPTQMAPPPGLPQRSLGQVTWSPPSVQRPQQSPQIPLRNLGSGQMTPQMLQQLMKQLGPGPGARPPVW